MTFNPADGIMSANLRPGRKVAAECSKALPRSTIGIKRMALWNLILLNPMLNVLVALGARLHSFGLAIIVVTVIVRGALVPIMQWQMRATRERSESLRSIRPLLERLKKKYSKDAQKLRQETWKLYREAGISPVGCLLNPTLVAILIQAPIILALSRCIRFIDAPNPQDFLGLSQHLYSWPIVNQSVPLPTHFLWLDLAQIDHFFVIPVLVAASLVVVQRMAMEPISDPSQRSMQLAMQIGMPLFFGLTTAILPSGLGLYLLTVSLIGIVGTYHVYGFGNLFPEVHRSTSSAR